MEQGRRAIFFFEQDPPPNWAKSPKRENFWAKRSAKSWSRERELEGGTETEIGCPLSPCPGMSELRIDSYPFLIEHESRRLPGQCDCSCRTSHLPIPSVYLLATFPSSPASIRRRPPGAEKQKGLPTSRVSQSSRIRPWHRMWFRRCH
jgi:hypothetical protein